MPDTRPPITQEPSLSSTTLVATDTLKVFDRSTGLEKDILVSDFLSAILETLATGADASFDTVTANLLLQPSHESIPAGGTSTAMTTRGSSLINTDAGGDIFTLADGVAGQEKFVIAGTMAGLGTITPANFAAGTSITMNAAGQSVHLRFIANEWHVVGGSGFTVI